MSPPVFTASNIRDSPPHENHRDIEINENLKVPAGISNNVKNIPLNGISQNVISQKLAAKETNEANLLVEEKDALNMSVDSSLAGPSTLNNSSLCSVQNTEELKATCYVTNKIDKYYMPVQTRNDTENIHEPIPSNNRVSDQGPTNASSFPGGFDSFLDHWEAIKEFYFDIHFSSRTDPNSSIPFDIFGLAVCWENSPVYYVNLSRDITSSIKLSPSRSSSKSTAHDYKDSSVRVRWDVAKSRWNRMVKIMSQNGVRKITWNLKTQIQVLKFPSISANQLGKLEIKELNDIQIVDDSYILLPPISVHDGIDMCIVSWILWPDEESKTAPNLEKVVKKRLSSEAAAAANRNGRWRNQMRKAAHDGCCRRVAQSRALGSVLLRLLVSENLVDALNRIENPLVTILADMELCGIGVDMEGCLRARNLLVKKLKELEKEAYNLAGTTFSLNSTADVADLLYKRLKLPVPQGCKKGKHHPSTDKHSLDMLRGQHPIISVIREHRTLAKLNGTLGSICSRARLCMKSQMYIVKGFWLQSSTATGRLSMEEPNLQCVEHTVAFTINHTENHSQSSQSGDQQVNPRDFFIPTQENWLLLTADYSQIELRLMAHFSNDSSLIELLRKPDGDCFTMIAARWTGKLESTISSHERDQTKRLIYGILYGMGASSLAEQLECSTEEANRKIKNFKNSFPNVSVWLNETVASCRHKGYIETLFGRKRFLSKIKFGNSKEKAKAERQAVNSICQGSAADIIKIAMVTIHTIIAEGFESPPNNNELAEKYSMLKDHCRIILQVHDELVLEVDPRFVNEAGSLLKTCMENAASLRVPLRVKMMLGKTWGSSEPFQLEP